MKKQLLEPVLEKDFQPNFSRGADQSGINPFEHYKTLIGHSSRLAVGPYFWFIADTVNGVAHSAGGMLEDMMPFSMKDFMENSTTTLFQNSHPTDITRLFAFTNHWVQYYMRLPAEKKPYVHATIYLRMLNRNQEYRWVMVQYADSLFNKEGNLVYGLTLVTDISHIKQDGEAMMSVLDATDQSCQHFYCTAEQELTSEMMELPLISKREREVLCLLAKGYGSKQIAAELKIAVKTTDHHRQSLLRKTNTKNTGELVAKAISSGLIA